MRENPKSSQNAQIKPNNINILISLKLIFIESISSMPS
ncbi:hypothetical protein EV07_1242 [Prochlorococcus sp. MIT 0603]|nr:hypothetical protein EV07_1242 [Prochlorococcus sp. MIT 0603]